MKIKINDIIFDVALCPKKNNKRMYLRFKSATELLVTYPTYTTAEHVLNFLKTKADWIYQTHLTLSTHEQTLNKGYINDTVFILGKSYATQINFGKKDDAQLKGDTLVYTVKQQNDVHIRNAFNEFAKRQLSVVLQQLRISWDEIVSNDYHLPIPAITIKNLKGKWGVCIPKKNEIHMSIDLIHYPKDVINAVLWHEYVHLIVPNHSKRFYNVVLMHMPNYYQYHNELKF